MKRFLLFSLLLMLLAAAIPLVLNHCIRTIDADECSPLYRRYAHVPGIEAAYVKAYRINDTLTVDATLLHATAPATWLRLEEDFEIPHPTRKTNASTKNKSIAFRSNKKGHAKRVHDPVLLNNDIITATYDNHTISIFHIADSAQESTLYLHLIEVTFNL